MKSERIFSSEYLGGIFRVVLIFLFFTAFIYGISEVDSYLKNNPDLFLNSEFRDDLMDNEQ